jgi:hypothetical protein
MKSRFLMSIIATSIVVTGFTVSNVAHAQSDTGSWNISQKDINRVCKPGNFDNALRTQFKGVRGITSQQRSRLRTAYENYRKELREYLKSNQCIDLNTGYFTGEIVAITARYGLNVQQILTKQQHQQWLKNVPPIEKKAVEWRKH